jgi:hypothetical protein
LNSYLDWNTEKCVKLCPPRTLQTKTAYAYYPDDPDQYRNLNIGANDGVIYEYPMTLAGGFCENFDGKVVLHTVKTKDISK